MNDRTGTTDKTTFAQTGARETATFAAGCFRCSEAAFQEEPGVIDAIAWYAGGSEVDPTYEEVSAQKTSHREAVQVVYDPAQVSYLRLLEIMWRSIDPTDPDGQFVDKGFQYTTAIFYHTEQQRQQAEQSLLALEESAVYDKPIVTNILPFTTFYRAEPYHQDFYKHSAERYKRYKDWSGREEYYDQMDDKSDATPTTAFVPFDVTTFQKPDDEQIRKRLTRMQYRVTQRDGTEPPFANKYRNNEAPWIYVDIVSWEPLFSSVDKFDSGTGRPSFTKPITAEAVTTHTDTSLWTSRTEVRSTYADSHLWHVFDDGPAELGWRRYCMNSASLRFIPKETMAQEGYEDRLYLFE